MAEAEEIIMRVANDKAGVWGGHGDSNVVLVVVLQIGDVQIGATIATGSKNHLGKVHKNEFSHLGAGVVDTPKAW